MSLVADTRTGRRLAIKFIPRASCSGPSGLVLRELQNHKACHGHPHVVELVVRGAACIPPHNGPGSLPDPMALPDSDVAIDGMHRGQCPLQYLADKLRTRLAATMSCIGESMLHGAPQP